MNVSKNSKDIAAELQRLMTERGLTLSTAESCTSGRIAAILTSVSGASDYFQGGIVAYQDDVKTRFLSVSPKTIAEHDVVSQEVVSEMVKGCCKLFHTGFAICSTGYTGTGANGIASGTIWIGWGKTNDIHTFCLTHDEGREANTANAAAYAVKAFWEYIGNY